MPLTAILARYGLLGIFLGAGVEGEAAVVAGGVLSHHGMVPLWAAAGSCIADQLWFIAGRRFREHRWVRAITSKPAFARAPHPGTPSNRLHFRLSLHLRAAHGQLDRDRHVQHSRIALRTAECRCRRDLGTAFTLLGYKLEPAVEPLLARFAGFGMAAAGAALLAGLLFLAVRKLRRRAE